MASKKNLTPSTNNNISISGDVKDSAIIIGDNNKHNLDLKDYKKS